MPISNWNYKGKEITTLAEIRSIMKNAYGFVYHFELINIKTKKKEFDYIGRKNLFSATTKLATKKEIQDKTIKKKTKKGKKYVQKISESNWKTYKSSNSYIKENETKYAIKRTILMFCNNESTLKYQEAKHIICSECLERDDCLNAGVSLRMFGNKIIE